VQGIAKLCLLEQFVLQAAYDIFIQDPWVACFRLWGWFKTTGADWDELLLQQHIMWPFIAHNGQLDKTDCRQTYNRTPSDTLDFYTKSK